MNTKPNHNILVLLLMGLLTFHTHAQLSTNTKPRSFTNPTIQNATKNARMEIPGYHLKATHRDTIQKRIKQDKGGCENCKTGGYLGIGTTVNIDIIKEGLPVTVPGGTIWRYHVTSDSAKGLQLVFNSFKLPIGSELHVYNDDKTMVLGGFTAANNTDGEGYILQIVVGDALTIEYFEPNNAAFRGSLVVEDIVFCFRDIYRDFSPVNPLENIKCDPTVKCIEGANFRNAIKSVVAIVNYGSSQMAIGCTGTLLNNTKQDGKPYIITASHCYNFDVFNPEEDYLNRLKNYTFFLFHQEKPSCAYNAAQDYKQYSTRSIVGGIPLNAARQIPKPPSLYRGTNVGDLLLIESLETPPIGYGVCYAGWELAGRTNGAMIFDTQIAGIHHPNGSDKRISISYRPVRESGYKMKYDSEWNGTKNFWAVNWSIGSTSGGSSGSGLFNSNERLIGTLSGGESECGADNSTLYDYYTKLETQWDGSINYPTLNTKGIKYYLANDNFNDYLDGFCPTVPLHCSDKIKNYDEIGTDCGGECGPCPPACDNGIMDIGLESGIDCGGVCFPCPTCNDYIKNQGETKVDCGGPCAPCATCNDGIKNQGETGLDCGGPCRPCTEFCNNNWWDGDELAIDCGGSCRPCESLITGRNSDFNLTVPSSLASQCGDLSSYYYPLTKEQAACTPELDWHLAYGYTELSYGSLKFFAQSGKANWKINPDCLLDVPYTWGTGVYLNLPKKLNPNKTYSMFITYNNFTSGIDSDGLFEAMDYFEIAAAKGLVPANKPMPFTDLAYLFPSSMGPEQYPSSSLGGPCPKEANYLLRDFHAPPYPFVKQTITDFGVQLRTDPRRIRFDFKVSRDDFDQLYIATAKNNYATNNRNQYHYSNLKVDDLILIERSERDWGFPVNEYPVKEGLGGRGFGYGAETTITPGLNCFNRATDEIAFVARTSYASDWIKIHNVCIAPGKCTLNNCGGNTPRPGDPIRFQSCNLVNLNAGNIIEITPPFGVNEGVTMFSATTYPCIDFQQREDGEEYIPQQAVAPDATDELVVIPNPSEGLVDIKFGNSLQRESELVVYDNFGKPVYQTSFVGNEKSLDLSKLPKGMYILKVKYKNSDKALHNKLILF